MKPTLVLCALFCLVGAAAAEPLSPLSEALLLHVDLLEPLIGFIEETPPEERELALHAALVLLEELDVPGRLPERMPVFGDEKPTPGTQKRWAMIVQQLDLLRSRQHISNRGATIAGTDRVNVDIPDGVKTFIMDTNFGATTLKLLSDATRHGQIAFIDRTDPLGSDAAGGIVYQHATDTMSLYTSAIAQLIVTNAGKVGVRRFPLKELHVLGDIEASGDVAGATGTFSTLASPGGLTIVGDLVVDTDTLVVDSVDSRVGVGTAAPTAPFHILGGGTPFSPLAGTLALFQNSAAAGDSAVFSMISGASSNTQVTFGDTAGQFQGRFLYDHVVDALRIFVNAAERARFDSSGNLGIGTVVPGEKLDVTGNIRATGTVEAGGAVFHGALASAPGSPNAGDMYFDTTTSKHRGYDGTVWNNFY